MFFLTLDCGRQVSVDSFEFRRTYAGLLEGRPTLKMNERIIAQEITGSHSTRGENRVYLLPPIIEDRDPDHPLLPPVVLRVRLTCYQPVDPDSMASQLVVAWFTGECHTKSIETLVFEAVRGVAWEQLAEDFDW